MPTSLLMRIGTLMWVSGWVLMPWALAYARTGIEISLALVALGQVLGSVATRRWQWLHHPVLCGSLVWYAGVLVVLATASIPVQDALYHSTVWLRYPLFLVCALCPTVPTERLMPALRLSLLVVLLLIVADTATQAITGASWSGRPLFDGARLTGPLRQPIIGMLLAKLAMLMVLVQWSYRPLRARLAWVGAAVLAIVISLLVLRSGERMSALLWVAGLASAGLCYARLRQLRMVRLIPLGGAAIGLVAGIGSLIPYTRERMLFFWEQLQHFSQTEYGQLYRAALALWERAPWFGIGMRQFRHQCGSMIEHPITCGNLHPHNMWLEILAEGGLWGITAFAAFFAVVVALPVRAWWGASTRPHPMVPAAAMGLWVMCLFPIAAGQSAHNNWAMGLSCYVLGVVAVALMHRPTQRP